MDSLDSISSDMDRLRLSALARAAAISPLVKEVTIGPNSPRTKRDTFRDTQSLIPTENNVVIKTVNRVTREDKIYLENVRRYETEMAQASDAAFAEMIERMIRKRAEISEKLKKAREEKANRNKKTLELHVQQILTAWKYNDPLVVKEICSHDLDSCNSHSSKTIENMNKIIEEQETVQRLASIKDNYAIVSGVIEKINQLPPNIKEIYLVNLNNIISNMNNILVTCGSGTVTEKEVTKADILAKNAVNLESKVAEDNKNRRLQEEKEKEKKKLEEQLQQQQAEAAKEQEIVAKKVETPVKPNKIQGRPLFFSATNFEHYTNLKNFLVNYEASYKDLTLDSTQKKFCFDCRKAVNVPVNSLCSVSGHHIRDKYDKLAKLLRGERVQVMDSYVSVTQHPQGLAYCTALLAKKLVNQGHLTVSSQPEAAFPLASVIIALWEQFPDLAKLIEANFHRECPYLVPMFLPQQEGQSKEDFLKSLGYLYDDEGQVEKQDKFLKRMSGIFRLCCAIWISKPPRVMTSENPHGLRYAWRWLASFINLKPVAQISSTLLFDFFTVCGHDCLKTYGKQFMKVIKLMCTRYMPELEQIDEGGPKSRLEIFLQNILQTGVIPPPAGLLQPNVW